MKRFIYRGVKKNGQKINGVLLSESEELVLSETFKNGIFVEHIKQDLYFLVLQKIMTKNIKTQDLFYFSREINMLLDASIPINRGIEILKDQKKEKIKVNIIAYKINKRLETGESFYRACVEVLKDMNDEKSLFLSIIKMGEESGEIEQAFESICNYYEREQTILLQVKKAMIYPKILMISIFFMINFMLIYVVPKFKSIFENIMIEGVDEIPIIIRFSEYLKDNIFTIYTCLFLIFILIKQIYKMQTALYNEKILFKIPKIGEIKKLKFYIKFLDIIGFLSAKGMGLDKSFEMLEESIKEEYFKNIIKRIKEKIILGKTLGEALKDEDLFDRAFKSYIQIAEELGSYEYTFLKLSKIYEKKLNNNTQNILTLIEPILIIVISILLGWVILSLLIPMFKILGNVDF